MMAPKTETLLNDSAAMKAVRSMNRRTMFGIAAFVVIAMLLGWVGMAYDENMEKWIPETAVNPSTYNKKPTGSSGILQIAIKSGIPTSLWLLPYRQLKAEHGTLVVFAPNSSLKPFEVEQILQWIKAGNKLVYLDHFNYSMSRHLLEHVGVQVVDGTPLKDTSLPLPDNEAGEFSHVQSVTVSTDTRLKGGTPLLTDKSGTLVTKLKYGKGEIILGTVSNICSNQRLSNKKQWGNFQLLMNLCRPGSGRLMFDERCHGYSKTSNVFVFFAKNPPGFCFAQLLLMLVLGIFGSFHRFGKTRQIDVSRKLSSTEFIDGLSNVYRRAKANNLAIEIIGRSYRTRWCKTTGVSAHDTTEETKERWTQLSLGNPKLQLWSQSAIELLSSLETAVKNNALHDTEFVQLAAGLEATDNQLTEIFGTTTTTTTTKIATAEKATSSA